MYSRWCEGVRSVRGLLVALYLRFNIVEDISDQTCSPTGADSYSVADVADTTTHSTLVSREIYGDKVLSRWYCWILSARESLMPPRFRTGLTILKKCHLTGYSILLLHQSRWCQREVNTDLARKGS